MRDDTNNEFFYLIGIDPGSNTGVAIYKIATDTLSILEISTFTVVLSNYVANPDNEILERNHMLSNVCNRLYETYNPVAVGIEAAFMNSRFPKAVMQLSQYTQTVNMSFYIANPFIRRFNYAPKYVKSVIGAGGAADKNDMYTTVTSIDAISSNMSGLNVSEHEIDALAIGYVALEECRKYPHLLFTYA